ncbi:hypothetical protein B0H66DRAFT_547253 [Apodospora peruviana]|uniref:Uncharacterized protein n=1 Tax=Apodospora peruviana TaxID=516989 RepID=A0AAE0IHB1_9PEZI|nr:hypothetical protein B0H66DRAFT_547253 [Apodospora peruviana]
MSRCCSLPSQASLISTSTLSKTTSYTIPYSLLVGLATDNTQQQQQQQANQHHHYGLTATTFGNGLDLKTRANEMDGLSAYIAASGLSSHAAEIRTLIAQGAHDVRAIMTSPSSADKLRRRAACETYPAVRDRQVTGIMWYLTALAVERNQGFVHGAFVCRDPNGQLSAYFLGVGTPRISSHLKRHSAPGCTGGIDLLGGAANHDDALPPLPHGHRHVLFISIAHDKRRGNCLFIKPEPYGVDGVLNFLRHSVDYVRSLARRRLRFGGNDCAGMRKERIPDRLVQDFCEAVAHLPDGRSAISEVGYQGEGDGIGCMHDYLSKKLADADADAASSQLPESARMSLTTILRRLESDYDFVSLRFGNEVFLDLASDITRPLPQAPGVSGPSPSLWWLYLPTIESE